MKRPQAVPILEGADWVIEPRDLAEFLAVVGMFSVAFVVWRAFSP